MHTLGLDVSTSCTGWCVLHRDGSLIEFGNIPLGKHKSTYKKAEVVNEILNHVSGNFEISRIYIEENLQSFRRGFSSAQTLSTLARFNGIVSLLCYQVFNHEPIHVNVNWARKSLGIKLIRSKNGGAPTKEQIQEWVDKKLNEENASFDWPIKILRGGPRKGMEILDPGSYDMADAYVVASAGHLIE